MNVPTEPCGYCGAEIAYLHDGGRGEIVKVENAPRAFVAVTDRHPDGRVELSELHHARDTGYFVPHRCEQAARNGARPGEGGGSQ